LLAVPIQYLYAGRRRASLHAKEGCNAACNPWRRARNTRPGRLLLRRCCRRHHIPPYVRKRFSAVALVASLPLRGAIRWRLELWCPLFYGRALGVKSYFTVSVADLRVRRARSSVVGGTKLLGTNCGVRANSPACGHRRQDTRCPAAWRRRPLASARQSCLSGRLLGYCPRAMSEAPTPPPSRRRLPSKLPASARRAWKPPRATSPRHRVRRHLDGFGLLLWRLVLRLIRTNRCSSSHHFFPNFCSFLSPVVFAKRFSDVKLCGTRPDPAAFGFFCLRAARSNAMNDLAYTSR